MLVLTRKTGERIIIGDGIVIEIVTIARDKVRVGVTAPPEVAVNREEVYDRIQRGEVKVKEGSVGSCVICAKPIIFKDGRWTHVDGSKTHKAYQDSSK